MSEEKKCPLCDHVLYRRYEGLVCKNHKCQLYFKLGKGWVLLKKTKRQENNEFVLKCIFNPTTLQNLKK